MTEILRMEVNSVKTGFGGCCRKSCSCAGEASGSNAGTAYSRLGERKTKPGCASGPGAAPSGVSVAAGVVIWLCGGRERRAYKNDDDDVYYSKGRRPREDEEGEESYEKRRQWPGRGG